MTDVRTLLLAKRIRELEAEVVETKALLAKAQRILSVSTVQAREEFYGSDWKARAEKAEARVAELLLENEALHAADAEHHREKDCPCGYGEPHAREKEED